MFHSGSPNQYPDRYTVPVNPQNPYGAYTSLPTGYRGNPYNPNDPLYGTVPRPPISIPSEIMNMMTYSRRSPSEPDIAQMGYELSLPYFQSAIMVGLLGVPLMDLSLIIGMVVILWVIRDKLHNMTICKRLIDAAKS